MKPIFREQIPPGHVARFFEKDGEVQVELLKFIKAPKPKRESGKC